MRLRELILARLDSMGWSQSDLARAANIPRQHISAMLLGSRPIRAKDLLVIDHVLNLGLDYGCFIRDDELFRNSTRIDPMNTTPKKLRCTVYFSDRKPVSGVAQLFEHCICPEYTPAPGHQLSGSLFWYGTVDLVLDDPIRAENLHAITEASKRQMVLIAFEDGRTGGVAFSSGQSQSARMEAGKEVHANFYWLCFVGMSMFPLPPQPALEHIRFIS